MKKWMVAVATVAVMVAGSANADAIGDRKALMKEKVGASMGTLGKIAKGEMEYDAAAVLASFTTMREAAGNFGDLFPEDSKEGGETTASPKIWEDMDGFKAQLAKFEGDLDAAITAAPADKDSFMAAFGPVAGNCKACHETYRVLKN